MATDNVESSNDLVIIKIRGGPCSGFACCSKPVVNPSYDPNGKAYGFEVLTFYFLKSIEWRILRSE